MGKKSVQVKPEEIESKLNDWSQFKKYTHTYVKVKWKRKCQLLCGVQLFATPMDCSPPGSSVHRIFQAIMLEWVAFSLSRGSSWLRDQTWVSCIGRQILYHLSHPGSPHICITYVYTLCFPDGSRGKESTCQCRRFKRCGFDPCIETIPWRRAYTYSLHAMLNIYDSWE